jgi:hypothetical protein
MSLWNLAGAWWHRDPTQAETERGEREAADEIAGGFNRHREAMSTSRFATVVAILSGGANRWRWRKRPVWLAWCSDANPDQKNG